MQHTERVVHTADRADMAGTVGMADTVGTDRTPSLPEADTEAAADREVAADREFGARRPAAQPQRRHSDTSDLTRPLWQLQFVPPETRLPRADQTRLETTLIQDPEEVLQEGVGQRPLSRLPARAQSSHERALRTTETGRSRLR
jgi:hypothetical protein